MFYFTSIILYFRYGTVTNSDMHDFHYSKHTAVKVEILINMKVKVKLSLCFIN
jgi:hypothetical protein